MAESYDTALFGPIVALKNGIFGALFVVSKQHHSTARGAAFDLAIKLCQMLSFVLSEDAGFTYAESSMSGLRLTLGLTTINGYAHWFTGFAFLGLFYFSLVWVAVLVSLFVWAAVSFARGSFAALWPLQLLRAIGSTSATLLFIPMVTLLLAGFRCEEDTTLFKGTPEPGSWWLVTGYACSGPGWILQAAITGLFLVLFVTLCALWAACVQDRHPLSPNLSAKAHGRLDLFFVVAKTVLVVMIKGWPWSIPPYAHIGVLLAAAVGWLAGAVLLQPYYHHSMNRANAGAASVLLAAIVTLAVGQAYPRFDAAISWYVALPFAAVAGIALCDMRAHHLAVCPPSELASPWDVQLRARFVLHQFLFGHPTDVLPVRDRGVVCALATVPLDRVFTSSSSASTNGDGRAPADEIVDNLNALSQEDDPHARVVLARKVLEVVRSNNASWLDGVTSAATVYSEGLARFRHSAMLHISASIFYAVYTSNHHLEMSHLLQAERMSPGIDLLYVIFATRRALEERGSSSRAGGGSALARVAFEKYSADAKAAVGALLTAQCRFWTELAVARPSLVNLHALFATMSSAEAQASTSFAALAKLNSRSLAVMRLLVEFTQYGLNDPDRASLLMAEMDRMADAAAKEMRAGHGKRIRLMEASNVDLSADSAGVIVVSAAAGSLGTILSVSPAACRMFGYPRSQLEHRPVDVLVPSPISEWHGASLRRFLQTGDGRMVDTTRMVLGQHKAGFIVPMLLSVRESSASDGPPTLVGLMQPLVADDDFVLMDGHYAVCSATERSMSAFGLTTANFMARDRSLRHYLPDLDAHLPELQSEAGALLTLQLPAEVLEADESPMDSSPHFTPNTRLGTSLLHEPYGSRRRSESRRSAAEPQGVNLMMSGRAATLQVRAWLTHHTSLGGHSFISLVWAPSSHHATSHLPGGEGTLTDTRGREAVTSALGCPFLAKEGKGETTTTTRSSSPASSTSGSHTGNVISPHSPLPRIAIPGSHVNNAGTPVPVVVDVQVHPGADTEQEQVRAMTKPGVQFSTLQSTPGVQFSGPQSPVVPSALSPSALSHNRRGSIGPGGDRGSYASSHSSVGGKRMIGRLRRVVAEKDPPLVPLLRLLRRVALVLSTVTGMLAIGLDQYATIALQSVVDASDVAFLTATMGHDVLLATHLLSAASFVSAGLGPNTTTAYAQERLDETKVLVNQLLDQENTLFTLASASSSDFAPIVLAPRVTFSSAAKDGVTGAVISTDTVVSVHDALRAYLLAVQRQATTPLPLLDSTSADFQLIRLNGFPGSSFTTELNATTTSATAYMTTEATHVRYLLTLIFTLTVGMLAAGSLMIILPASISLEATRNALLKEFITLPPIIVNSMRAQAERRLQAFQASDDGDDDGDVGSEDEEMLDMDLQQGPGGGTAAKDADGGAVLPMDADGEVDWTIVAADARARRGVAESDIAAAAAGAKTASAAPRKVWCGRKSWCNGSASSCCKGRESSSSSSASGGPKKVLTAWALQPASRALTTGLRSILFLLSIFILPVIFLIIILMMYVLITQTSIDGGIRATHAAVASQHRAVLARSAMLNIRRTIRIVGGPDAAAPALASLRDLSQGLEYWSHDLLLMPVLDETALSMLPTDTPTLAQGTGKGAGIDGLSGDQLAQLTAIGNGHGFCDLLISKHMARYFFYDVSTCEGWPKGLRSATAGVRRIEDDWRSSLNSMADRRAYATVVSNTQGTIQNPRNNATTSYSAATEFAGYDFSVVDTGGQGLMIPAYQVASSILSAASKEQLEGVALWQTELIGSGLAVYAVLVAVVCGVIVPRVNVALLKQRTLLLLLPLQVLNHPSGAGLRAIAQSALAASGLSLSSGPRAHVGSSAGSVTN